jgi:hypothetical protein
LKDDYEGGEVSMTYGAELETGNSAEFEINGLVGGNFANGRGNLTTYASYYNREGVLQSEYDYSRISGGVPEMGTDRPLPTDQHQAGARMVGQEAQSPRNRH